MRPAVSFAVVGFGWRGDVARPVELTLVFHRDVADAIAAGPMEDLVGVGVYALPAAGEAVATLVSARGTLPPGWRTPLVADILAIRLT